MFAWYGKRRRLQYCLYSDTLGRLHSARLAWPGGTVLKMHRAWQGTILGITVDLSALPYLLLLIPGPSPSGRPRLVVPSWARLCVGRGRIMSRSPAYPRSKKEVGVGLCPHFGQAFRSGTGSMPWPVIMYLDQLGRRALSLRCLLGRVFAEKRAHWGPRVYEPDWSP